MFFRLCTVTTSRRKTLVLGPVAGVRVARRRSLPSYDRGMPPDTATMWTPITSPTCLPSPVSVTNGSISKQITLLGGSSICTAELKALMMALDMIINNNNKFYVIFTDSLSSLMAPKGQHFHHLYIFNIIDQYTHLLKLNKTVVFAWIPSHVRILGNE